MHENANSLVVLDFETTGLSPNQGDRAIEIGAVRIVDGKVTDKFQSLMNPGFRISGFIEQYTGISNQMLAKVGSCGEVMAEFADFLGDDNLLAHNASFDQKFLDAELNNINRKYFGQFICSLLVSRRINIDAPNHKLGTLIRYKNIPSDGAFHRALFDAEMTAKLWLLMLDDIEEKINHEFVPFALIQKLSKTAKSDVSKLLTKW
ncbi:3'-5' exonuclease [Colwellia sp. BRX10-6]|uniref:3'-5' exonuclease n=1 Tax=unclassified Colwellia TaxID=196834 RepID=UPI0015F6229B|nr:MULTISPECIES: 3'-5' exonuclease [unclassified Colwellia]MBA6353154.1 3'-5' exonuclease [Colwellia sp. BRX9-1]MBA6383864.1 3'-5' exonuclease [Colwellia sp. BRX10-9]MBA6393893.1 3'-5' exonuclease [Colwellia sp. BRX10-6]